MPCAESQIARKLVTALEILRFYAEAYANDGYNIALAIRTFQAHPGSLRFEPMVIYLLRKQLEKLTKDCAELPCRVTQVPSFTAFRR